LGSSPHPCNFLLKLFSDRNLLLHLSNSLITKEGFAVTYVICNWSLIDRETNLEKKVQCALR
jgi:hypothetical protein